MGDIYMNKCEWLEPSIDKRISEITDEILIGPKNEGYKDFMKLLRNQINLEPAIIMELGDLFISNIQFAVEESYRKGVEEILNIKN